MSDAFVIDASELIALGNRAAGAPAIVREEIGQGAREAGFIVTAQAVINAPIKLGTLRSGIGPPEVVVVDNGAIVTITSHAKHSLAVEKGRRGFSAAAGRVLHFFIDGKEIFTKRVGPAKAQPFLAPALKQTAAKTTAVFAKALDRATSRILGGR
jgi:hypothetical protein